MANVSIIGAGFSGLTAACVLSKEHDVTIYEKNDSVGGRARQFQAEGFTFDMGPSWYWMPEVFEQFYNRFGYTASDFYDLKRLDPSYSVVFQDDIIDIPASLSGIYDLFESIEKGSADKLKKFLKDAKVKYDAGMSTYVWKPGKSWFEYINPEIFKSVFSLQMLSSVSKEVRKLFKNPKLIQILEFPVLFLGDKPSNTPALYSLMNYADIALGTWYPIGGMYKIVEAFTHIAKENGVEIKLSSPVTDFAYSNKKVESLKVNGQSIDTDFVVASADYHHVDTQIHQSKFANHTSEFWNKQRLAPSSLLFYIGLDCKIPNLHHHTLFFDADFDHHADEIYSNHRWPTDPLFYVCSPSVTDLSVAPQGRENLFILMPISTYVDQDDPATHQQYFDTIAKRIARVYNIDISKHIAYKRTFSISDFKSAYNAFRGNAYGLANTLMQTGPLKPKMHHRTLSNMLNCGQLTVPGPGVPPAIVSGQLVAAELNKLL